MAHGIRVKSGGETTFDSNKGHLLVDINHIPKHIGLVTITPTALVSGGQTHTNLAYEYDHGLDYTPFVETYFFPAQSQELGVYDTLGVDYYHNYFPLTDMSVGAIEEYLSVVVGPTKLRVNYTYSDLSATPTLPTTSTPYPVTMKFLIFSNDGYWMSGGG